MVTIKGVSHTATNETPPYHIAVSRLFGQQSIRTIWTPAVTNIVSSATLVINIVCVFVCVCLFVVPFVCSIVCSFVCLFVCLFVYLFV